MFIDSRIGSRERNARTAVPRWTLVQRSEPTHVVAVATTVLAVGAVVFALHVMRDFLIPTAAAIVLAVMLSPISRVLERMRVPPLAASALTVVLVAGGCIALLIVVLPQMSELSTMAPRIARALESKLQSVRSLLTMVSQATKDVEAATTVTPDAAAPRVVVAQPGVFSSLLVAAPSVIVQVSYAIGLVFLLIAERERFRRVIVALPRSFAMRRRVARMSREVSRLIGTYLFSIAAINTGLGICTAVALFALGMPNAAMWGTGMALVNFIPIVGPLAMTIVIGVVGAMTFESTGAALMPAAAVLSLHLLEGQVVYPLILGRRVSLSPVAVFLAVAFFAWLWGVVGAIVAVPLLILGSAAIRQLLLTPRQEAKRAAATSEAPVTVVAEIVPVGVDGAPAAATDETASRSPA
ncbi:MAG: AI-2E family transporter [Alphaproteobacteria bacterium]|nr:AI-2E family transporter [Alphaproteobacteria bacterium]